MYLHIGNHKNVRIRDLVGVFDLDSASVSGVTKAYLRKSEKEGRVRYATSDLPKSFLVMKDRSVCFSQLSTSSLSGRLRQGIGE